MRAIVKAVIDSMTDHPEQWEIDKYRVTHGSSGIRFWVSNGFYGFDPDGSMRSISYWEKRKIWKAYVKMCTGTEAQQIKKLRGES